MNQIAPENITINLDPSILYEELGLDLESLGGLINVGVWLTRVSERNFIIHNSQDHVSALNNIYRTFSLWRYQIKQLVYTNKLLVPWVADGDGVPEQKAGLDYSNFEGVESQQLITAIRVAASKKLTLLRDLVQATSQEEIQVEQPIRFPYDLPSGTRWEHFIIQFLDYETIKIFVQGNEHKARFNEMGFQDQRNGKPNQQWGLLKILADKGGELPPGSPEAMDKLKKTKQLLTEQLQQYFQIDYDPFFEYNNAHGYKIKLSLMSGVEPVVVETDNEDDVLLGMEEMFK